MYFFNITCLLVTADLVSAFFYHGKIKFLTCHFSAQNMLNILNNIVSLYINS